MRLEQVRTGPDRAVGLDVGQAPHPERPKPPEPLSLSFSFIPEPPHPWRWMQPGWRRARSAPFVYVRRTHNRGGEPMLWRGWLKWLFVVETDHQMVLAQEACSGPYNGSAMLRPLVDAAHEVTPIGVILVDAELDREHNHRHVRDRLAAVSVIPAKRGKGTWQVQGYRAKMQAAFPHQLYRRGSW
jgi:hypothetical protein